ncbi:MAG TPA: hypothetical protein VMQ76_13235 [Terracidiphilus sp.]|nr:hypothetical protein [Terracidiphilus sp.]
MATLKIPYALHLRLKVKAAQTGSKLGELVAEYLESGLKPKLKTKSKNP